MPTLHKYVGCDGVYIKHSFPNDGRLFHVVYQVDQRAEELFKSRGIVDGCDIPKGLFFQLLRDGQIYTQKSGVKGEELVDSDAEHIKHDIFHGLSPEARWWIVDMVSNHPEVKIVDINSKTFEVQFEKIPEHYIYQLSKVARLFDGTDFLKNLKMSYKSIINKEK
jgi:hypothetical protein